jgi:staphylococcal nuclease domain-containing protein 1
LRAAEKAAKDKKLGLWEGYGANKSGPTGTTNGAVQSSSTTKGSSFDAVVTRIWGSDQISVIAKSDASGKERRLQFASVRGPK